MIGKLISHYKIVAELGRGGMGEVYLAEDTKLKRQVALKFLPPQLTTDAEAKERFEREAQAAAALHHPNIVTIHEINEHEGQIYIAMEYIEGWTLKELITSVGAIHESPLHPELPLQLNQIIDITMQIAEGLAAAHAKGIIHRDIKPANIFITQENAVKILDFGIAKLTGGQTKLTKTGTTLGTITYMSPEQAMGKEVDQRTDIWSLAVILYEMVAGQPPFVGDYEQAVVYSILNEEPKPLAKVRLEIPVGLEQVVSKALAKDPADRYQSMAEFLDDLQAVAGGLKPLKARPKWIKAKVFGIRKIFIFSAAALLAVLLGLNVGGVRNRLFGPGGASLRTIRLAVLPLENLSGDSQQEYFSDGMTQELIAHLGRLHTQKLSVIAYRSVLHYKKSNASIEQIGRELGVDYVLEGSAQREGSRVRITAELIQVKDQTQLWADSFEREMSGILTLQGDVSQEVVGAIGLKLLPSDRARLTNARAVNPEAYDAYLRGSHYYIFMTKADLDTAEQYFQLALTKDQNFAAAYAGIALVWACRQQIGYSTPAEASPKARAAAQKAVALDDTSAEAHFALADIMTWTDWNFKGAEGEWKRTIELKPNYADGLATYSHYLMIIGRPDEGMAQIERAVKLDPYNVMCVSFYIIDLEFVHRYDEAIVQAHKALALQPGNPVALWALPIAYVSRGMNKEAIVALKDYCRQIYGMADIDTAMDRGFAEAGFKGAMRQAADALAVLARKSLALPTDVVFPYIWADDKAHALEWLKLAYEAHDPSLPYLRQSVYDPIRTEPQFQDIFLRLGLAKSEKK